ncbi:MAG: N-acetylmuramoyl-L-alanine amidase, partial [Megasphaera sp.]|nr:N-acetylmuramoyl-L-alanine amidase [Megasphaera sp.]
MKQSKTLSALAVALWLAFGFSSLSLAASPSDTTAAYTVGTVSENSKAVTKEKPKKEKTSDKKKTTDKKGGAAKGQTEKSDKTGEAAAEGVSTTASIATGSVPRTAKPAGARGVLKTYNPATDAAPAEPMAIRETNFRFNEP